MLCTEVEYVKEEDRLNEQFETWMETFVERANAVLDDVVRGKVDDCIQKRLLEGPTHAQKHASVSEPADDLIKKCLEALDALIDDKLSTREEVTVSTSGVTLVDGEESNPTIVPMTVGHSLGGCDVRHRSFLGGVNSARSARASQASEVEQEYRLSASVWDASLFFFVGGLSSWDRFLIGFGFAMNLVIQSVMVWALVTNMSDLDFDADSILRKLEWRVERGHAYTSMDVVTGTTMLTKLCERSLWSFEQEEYKQIYDYLYRPVPGIYLTLLAVLLWVMSTLGEFRLTLEKALALIAIPVVPQGAETLQCLNSQYEVVGWRKCHRIPALIVMVVPRLVVLVVLCGAGCIYLSRIVSLSEIVLNACGLAFVLDIDEVTAAVFLPRSVLVKLTRTRSLKYGNPRMIFNNIAVKDILRFVLLSFVTFSVFVQVSLPFRESVEASAVALCGGRQNITFKGGDSVDVPLVVSEAGVAKNCRSYVHEYYPEVASTFDFEASPSSASADSVAAISSRRLMSILSFAYSDCSIWATRDIHGTIGRCKSMNTPLRKILEELNVSTEGNALVECPRLNLASAEMCDLQTVMPPVCRWSHVAEKCEGSPPGLVATVMCSDDIWTACSGWTHLQMSHPKLNCIITTKCQDGYNCMLIRGMVALLASNQSGLFPLSTVVPLIRDGILQAISEVSNLDANDMGASAFNVNIVDVPFVAGSTASALIHMNYTLSPLPTTLFESSVESVDFKEAIAKHVTEKFRSADIHSKILKATRSSANIMSEMEAQNRKEGHKGPEH
eukprot:TRINITY_DN16243_c1_g1_i2.p1 TRINITY_DN16243_c1_g1~~TRINITY_DN16243_c1_g1_i2.p1  ORF type:complete len:784 (-),score=108.79 TRINITY_DN16243_c1_g1_i2:76-2427(-)